jgi:hypothetical protein
MGAVVESETFERSLAQRMDALQLANAVRTRRADTKKAIARGELGAGEVLGLIAEPPAWMETMLVFDLLLSVPKVGRVKANKVLRDLRISPSRTLGGISERQRGELVESGRNGWQRRPGERPAW